MTDNPEMSEHPDVDHPAPDTPEDDVPGEERGVGQPLDPADPLKRDEDLPGADPITPPISPD